MAQCVGSVNSTIGKLATSAQTAANEANDGVKKANIKIGDLEISIEGKVSFTDLSTSGNTTISGGNIKTDRIEAQDGSWWLDLDTGKFYLKDGIFAGEIVWSDSNGNEKASIKYGGQAGMIIAANGIPMTIEASSGLSINKDTNSSVDIGGDLLIDGHLSIGGEIGYSGQAGIKYSNGSDRIWRFEDGALMDNNV